MIPGNERNYKITTKADLENSERGMIMQVYDRLIDDISKKIYLARVNFSLTDDWEYLTKLPMEYKSLNADTIAFYQSLYSIKGKKVIFGAGANGKSLVKGFKDLDFEGFIDNFSKNTVEEWSGLPIFRLEQYVNRFGADYAKIIISIFDRKQCAKVAEQLIAAGIDEKNIICIPADWRNNFSQYFDVFIPHENETFVDCGCFDGSTAFRFAGWSGQLGYQKIWSFEPDKNSYVLCKKALSVLGKCNVYPYGISNRNGTALFYGNGKEDSKIVTNDSSQNAIEIQTITLDSFLENEKVSFIKMDIEGAEYKALEGAARIIAEQKPRLAISIYHRNEDVFLIPQLLLELRKDYKFYVRHYSLVTNETVLYAE